MKQEPIKPEIVLKKDAPITIYDWHLAPDGRYKTKERLTEDIPHEVIEPKQIENGQ